MAEYPMVIAPLSEEDGGGFVAYFPDLPGCMSDGETREEALENGLDAFDCWMDAQKARDATIDPPGAAMTAVEQRIAALSDALSAARTRADAAEKRVQALEDRLAGSRTGKAKQLYAEDGFREKVPASA